MNLDSAFSWIAAFDADEDTQIVLLHLIQVIGELVAGLSDGFIAQHPGVPWRQIVATRCRVVHGYFEVDPNILLGGGGHRCASAGQPGFAIQSGRAARLQCPRPLQLAGPSSRRRASCRRARSGGSREDGEESRSQDPDELNPQADARKEKVLREEGELCR